MNRTGFLKRRKPLATAKRKSLSYYKKKCWKVFSEWVRRKDADENGMTSCYSCGRVKHYKELQAGHLIPKSLGLSMYFEERAVRPQCYHCNINLSGNTIPFSFKIVKEYGAGILEELEALSRTSVKYSIPDYEEMIERYQTRIAELDKGSVLI